MPGVALHFVLARTVLQHWRSRTGSPPPFDIDDRLQIDAFHHGAIGPDLGYFPGGERILSDLSHCVRTGALTRALIVSARTPVERAFAWGWLTHVVGDREIHPLVGRGVGELTGRSRHVFVDGSSDPLSHLRVEVGLDCWFAERHPEARDVRLVPIFDRTGVGFLQRAYNETYAVEIERDAFLVSHRQTAVRAGQALGSLWFVAALMREAAHRPFFPAMGRVLRAAWGLSMLRGVSLAYLNPVRPGRWLIEEARDAVPRCVAAVVGYFEGGIDDLGDYNLDTGLLSALGQGHAGTTRALAGLDGLRGKGRRAPAPRVVTTTAPRSWIEA